MQVFVPLPTYEASVRVLDNRRLFKQLLEAFQILNVILDRPKADGTPRKGWRTHPAVVQWRPWPGALLAYAYAARDECDRRGIRTEKMTENLDGLGIAPTREKPDWWGDDRVHSSHRARLLQKDFDHYRQFGWPENDDPALAEREYLWPVPTNDGKYELVERRAKPRVPRTK